MKPIRKAIFPVAGLGTRFLPATKAMPKEMLPVVDRPLIQHVVDEARDAGIEHFIFVTGRNKGVIEDHFDRQFELELTLEGAQQDTPTSSYCPATCPAPAPPASPASNRRSASATRSGARANWSATSRSRCCCPTCWCRTTPGCLAQMIDAYRSLKETANVIAVEEMPPDRIHQYGVVGVGKAKGKTFAITEHGGEAAAREGAVQSHHHRPLHPAAGDLQYLATQQGGAGGEIQITDAMIRLAKQQPFYGLKFEGRSFDCGSKVGFLAANVAYALERKDIAPAFRKEISNLLGKK